MADEERRPLSPDGIATTKAMAAQAVETSTCVDAVIDGRRWLVIPDVVVAELEANGVMFTPEHLARWAESPEGRRAIFIPITDDLVITPETVKAAINA